MILLYLAGPCWKCSAPINLILSTCLRNQYIISWFGVQKVFDFHVCNWTMIVVGLRLEMTLGF